MAPHRQSGNSGCLRKRHEMVIISRDLNLLTFLEEG